MPIAAANHHAPACGAIHGRNGLNHLAKLKQIHPGSAQGRGHEQVEDPGIEEGINHRAREVALALCLIGVLSDQGREGWYWFGVWIREHVLNDPWPVQRKLTFPEVIQLLEPASDGVFYRHPKLAPWNNPYDKDYGFSRDQMVPLVAAMGVWGLTDELHRLWNALFQDVVGGTKHTFNGE